MDAPLITSFYCDPPGEDWYSKSAVKFKESCDRFNIRYDVNELAASESWLENTRAKAKYVLDRILHHKRDLLWIDIDTRILAKPVYAWDLKSDFAAPRFTGMSRLSPRLLIRSTAMWFNYTPATIGLIEQWVEQCRDGRYGDHREISNLLHQFNGKTSYMPDSYAHEYKQPDSVMVMGMAVPVKSRTKEMKEIANEIAQARKA